MLAPSDYLERATLLKLVRQAGLDVDLVRKLLWLVNADPTLTEFPIALKTLSAVIDEAEKCWTGILELRQLDWMPELLDSLKPIAASIDFKRLCRQGIRQREGIEWIGSGTDWLGRNAFYSSLRFSRENEDGLLREHRRLHAHYFLAHAFLVKSRTTVQEYERYGDRAEWAKLEIMPYHAGLGVRHFCEDDTWANLLLEKMSLQSPPLEFAMTPAPKIGGDIDGKSRGWVQDQVDYVCNFVQQAYGLKQRYAGWGSMPGGSHDSPQIGDPEDPSYGMGDLAELEDWNDLDQSPRLPLNLKRGTGTRPRPRASDEERLSWDDCPDEDENGDGIPHSWSPGDKELECSPGSYQAAVTGLCNQLIRQNKAFAFAYSNLFPAELIRLAIDSRNRVNTLLSWLTDGVEGLRPQQKVFQTDLPRYEELELLVFLLTMLWTGSDVTRTKSLQYVDWRAREGAPGCSLAIVGDGWSRKIRVTVPFPDYRQQQEPVPDADRNRKEFLFLPDTAGIGRLLMRFGGFWRFDKVPLRKNKKPTDANDHDARFVFLKSPEYYRESLTLLLRQWDPSGRLTLNKIAQVLWGRVMTTTGNDIVAATMITGRRHHLARVPMFYACRCIAGLESIYQRVVVELWAAIRQESNQLAGHADQEHVYFPPENLITLEPEEEDVVRMRPKEYVGRRLCPTDGAVEAAISRLKHDIQNPGNLATEADWWLYHNRFTLYTVWFFDFATGVRAVISPYLDPAEVSPLNSTAQVRDKDSDTGSKAKRIWVLPSLFRQMGNYAGYIRNTRLRFSTIPPCCFLNAEGKPVEVRPRTIVPIMAEYFPGFPIAIHRRYMYNELLDSGCPPEVVRVWMGHAVTGEEVWASSATLSPARYREILGSYLTPILDRIGFEPIDGCCL